MGWFDFFIKRKVEKSSFVKEYEDLFKKKIPSQRPISQLTFVVLDTETTGFDLKKDYVVSFGAIKVRNYRMMVSQSMEVYFEAPLQKESSLKVHEILYPISTSPLKNFSEDFLNYIENDIIVGHHIGFDLSMLEKILKNFGFRKYLNPVIDTQTLAIRLEKGFHYNSTLEKPGEFSLDALCERYGIGLDDRHTSAGDAFLTAQLLMKLLKIAEKKGIKDFGSLMR